MSFATSRIWFIIMICAIAVAFGGDQAAARQDENDAVYTELATRPVHMPAVGAGEACPHSAVGPIAAERIGSSLGGGPVFLTLGHNGVAQYHSYDMIDGLYTSQVIWAVAPDIRSPILIRGQQINGPNTVHFASEGMAMVDTLRFGAPPGISLADFEDSWRFAAASLGVGGPGCYVLQADGPYFSESIVFEVAIT